MQKFTIFLFSAILMSSTAIAGNSLQNSIKKDYDSHLENLFFHFHKNPELSLQEHKTAARLAKELEAEGFKVTQGVGGTGVVAILKNGKGPIVMMRADIDGLPIEEKSGLSYASKVTQKDKFSGDVVSVMHGCGHDVHITSLIGTARRMAAMKDQWSGTLMLLGQPAEERLLGAKMMKKDGLWKRFGKPEYALSFHVSAGKPAGIVDVTDKAPYAGADMVDIIIHGVGAHGASPHAGKDPIVLGSQIVLALQTLVARELSPRDAGVVTVGSFHSGTKHNIISDRAVLQLTVRNTNEKTRKTLLEGIIRIAENMGRVAGLPEDKLPEVIFSEESTPPLSNNPELANRLKNNWIDKMGKDAVVSIPLSGMGAEDFAYFMQEPYIKGVYFSIGGTAQADLDAAEKGGPAVPSHHSPLFKITPKPAILKGVEATVLALLELMPKN